MRVFWIILTLVIAGSGAFVFKPKADTKASPAEPVSAQSASSNTDLTRTASTVPTETAEENRVPAATESTNDEFRSEVARIEVGEEAPSTPANTSVEELDSTAEKIAHEEMLQNVVSDSSKLLEITADEIIATLDGSNDDSEVTELVDAETESVAADTEVAAPNGWELLAEQANEENAEESTEEAPAEAESAGVPAAMTIARNEDGSITIGDTYTITGSGTRENPYMVSWEYMVSLREYYNPREGKKAIPSHIAMFDGSYVSIAGYLQFPLATPEPVECLVMLNQWDGCCIGVPPTPYDAIEVSLSDPASREQKFAVEGRIVGKLKIDPYLVGNWLIGLYLLTDASVDVSGSRTAEEVYGNTPSQLIPGVE